MSITEYERNRLFMWFEENMGKKLANAMMSLPPPVGWADVATKRDLDVLAERMDTKIDRAAERLDAKIDHLESRIDGVEARMATTADLHALRGDLQRTFVGWMFATQGAVVAAIGILLAVMR